jgi:hypothetical protein
MAESQASPDHGSLEDLTPEEANRIIHSHRKVRYGKQRKCRDASSPPNTPHVIRSHVYATISHRRWG